MTAPHLGPGQAIAGKYTVRVLLAFTREVATYEAVSGQGQEVIVKLFDPAMGQRADVMGQLDRTRQLVAALPVENVVPVIDSGYDVSTSAPFSVTEKLSIPSVAQLVANGPLSEAVVGAIMHGVAQALELAAQQQLFHHALKPTNVFVGPAPAYPVRLIDFGASVVRNTSPTHEAYLAAAPWWAPEQTQPAAMLRKPTDVFTAALVAFYALTGRSYWQACQQSPVDLNAWRAEVMAPRAAISARAGEYGVPINAALDGVFLRALAVTQSERPAGVEEIAQALVALGGGGAEPMRTLALPEEFDSAALTAAAEQAAQQAMAAPGYPPVPAAAQPGAMASETPGLPAFPPAPKKQRSAALVPIIIGVFSALLIGGGAVAYLFWREGKTAESDDDAEAALVSSSSASATASGAAPPSLASAAVSADPSPPASGSAEAEELAKVEVMVKCKPQCDALEIDGEKVEDLDRKLTLLPGKHTLQASKRGYVTRKVTLELELGEPVEKEIALVKIPVRRPQRPCGQFLRPCR